MKPIIKWINYHLTKNQPVAQAVLVPGRNANLLQSQTQLMNVFQLQWIAQCTRIVNGYAISNCCAELHWLNVYAHWVRRKSTVTDRSEVVPKHSRQLACVECIYESLCNPCAMVINHKRCRRPRASFTAELMSGNSRGGSASYRRAFAKSDLIEFTTISAGGCSF